MSPEKQLHPSRPQQTCHAGRIAEPVESRGYVGLLLVKAQRLKRLIDVFEMNVERAKAVDFFC